MKESDHEVVNALESGQVLERKNIPDGYTWDLTKMFASLAAWEDEFKRLEDSAPLLTTYRGKLGSNPKILLEFLNLKSDLSAALERLTVFAQLFHDSDTAVPVPLELVERAGALNSEFDTALSFESPEILNVGEKTITSFLSKEPGLKTFEFALLELFRQHKHVRSEEVEEVLALGGELYDSPESIYEKLNDSDLKFHPIFDGPKKLDLSQGNIEYMLVSSDRAKRETAYKSYTDSYINYENTLAACLSAEVKKSVFLARAHNYESTLHAALHPANIPEQVYHNTVATVRKHFPIWHRYWKVRARALGLKKISTFDIHAPLSPKPPKVTYEQAIQYVIDGLQPLGDEYMQPLSEGLKTGRWVDVYSNKGKRSNAYSSGPYGGPPYLLLNYGATLSEMSVLAHELGHSMHTWFTNRSQNYANSQYTMLVAEVASNFNQALVRASLLKKGDRNFSLAMLDEAFYNFHRYLFTMPILAAFELAVHQRVESGAGVSASYLNNLMADLYREGYGEWVDFDEHRAGVTWAQYGHLYTAFYVFQYTTGISAANALARDVLSGDRACRDKYLTMLKAGNSKFSIDILKEAGVDLSTPKPIESAFQILNSYIDRLEELVDTPP